jgi:hypothetical protein
MLSGQFGNIRIIFREIWTIKENIRRIRRYKKFTLRSRKKLKMNFENKDFIYKK